MILILRKFTYYYFQMDPEVYSPLAKEYNLHRSPLEHIYGEYSEQHKHKILLNCNYRTHEDILKFPSKFFYRDKLKSSNLIEKHPDFSPLMFLQSDSEETYSHNFQSYINEKEADKIVRFLKEMLLPRWPTTLWGKLEDNPNGIGIVTTEYAQVHIHSYNLANMQLIYIVFCCLGQIHPYLSEKRANTKNFCGHYHKCRRYVADWLDLNISCSQLTMETVYVASYSADCGTS